ncbi:hypothetical protein [Streptomyces sp. NRRL F-5123]|uniref:hypothetical protein n=1 Tax=Streptomyces sp. NRRL F-5123 TaxID=1463856 RepID=UPI0004E20BC5
MEPDAELVGAFRRGGGGDKTVGGGLKVCWDTDRDRAVDTVHRLWATEQRQFFDACRSEVLPAIQDAGRAA